MTSADPAVLPSSAPSAEKTSSASLRDVPTPALVLDRPILDANLARMAARAEALGVALRPHLKTAKSVAVAARAAGGPVAGFTVSTLKEAEYFHAHGHRDLFYAVSIEPGKFKRAAALLRAGAVLTISCDDVGVARRLAAAGGELGVVFPTLIEIDCGEHRSGLAPDDARVIEIARILAGGAGTRLAGVCTHGGHSYAGRTPAEHRAVAGIERLAAVTAAEAIRAAGLACPVVSVGSSPTAVFAEHLRGVTELRCGVYMLGDLFQAGIGMCRVEDLALSVVTAVIGHRPDRNTLLVDAGGLALSKDLSTAKLPPERQAGYGWVGPLEGGLIDGFAVTAVHQEHGQITAPTPIDFARFPIGSRLRVWPNHACMTAAAYDHYHVVAGGTAIEAEWSRINGW